MPILWSYKFIIYFNCIICVYLLWSLHFIKIIFIRDKTVCYFNQQIWLSVLRIFCVSLNKSKKQHFTIQKVFKFLWSIYFLLNLLKRNSPLFVCRVCMRALQHFFTFYSLQYWIKFYRSLSGKYYIITTKGATRCATPFFSSQKRRVFFFFLCKQSIRKVLSRSLGFRTLSSMPNPHIAFVITFTLNSLSRLRQLAAKLIE